MTKTELKQLNNSLKKFINTVHYDELLCYNENTGEMVVAGEPLPPEVTNQIISEIRTLRDGLFWNFIVKDVIYAQNKVLVEQGSTVDDLIFNRAVKFSLQTLTKIIRQDWGQIIERKKE